MPEKQSWTEAVIECVSDKAERERLISLYDHDELVQACLLLGTFVLALKAERRELKSELDAIKAAASTTSKAP